MQFSFLCAAIAVVTTIVCPAWTTAADPGIIEGKLQVHPAYHISWTVNSSREIPDVTFKMFVLTTGFIGFGISPDGSMTNADVVTGGVSPDGVPYFADRWSAGHSLPKVDDQHNWHLLSAFEGSTHTIIVFTRALETGDAIEDIVIRNETTHFIWSWGDTDELSYHRTNRGATKVNIFAPIPA